MRKEDRERLQNKKMTFTREAPPAEITPQAGTWERVTDTAPQGMTWEGLPEGIQDQIDNAISDFCLYECKPPVSDLSQARAPLWSACCQYIGNVVYKRYKILRRGRGDREPDGRWIPYDENVMAASVPLWAHYCGKYQKAPLTADFGYFIGASWEWIFATNEEQLTPSRMRLTQKLRRMQEAGLAGLISDGRGNPTGAIAILNHWHGWNQTAAPQEKAAAPVLSVHDLPRLDTNVGRFPD